MCGVNICVKIIFMLYCVTKKFEGHWVIIYELCLFIIDIANNKK